MKDIKTADPRPLLAGPELAPKLPILTAETEKTSSWQRLLAEAVRDSEDLCRLLELPAEFRAQAAASAKLFPLVVPRGFVGLMRKGDPNDPLLRQVLPVVEEQAVVPGFTADPVGESAVAKVPGMLHKYARRALLVLNGTCAIHCRYCFRRDFPYSDTPRGLDAWLPALSAIEADESLDEVILSGGDPLTMTDEWLARLIDRLRQISHLKRLRIHSRLPIVLPERVTTSLIDCLTTGPLQPIVVVHANHPNELGPQCLAALDRLVEARILVLNQSVLLRGINDSADILADLCLRLIEHRVIPYYLHQLDRVTGAAHFEVPDAEALQIMHQLRSQLPGYATPKLVREIPGQPYKVPL